MLCLLLIKMTFQENKQIIIIYHLWAEDAGYVISTLLFEDDDSKRQNN